MTDRTGPRGLRMAGTIAALTADSSYVRHARRRDVDRILEVIGTYVARHVLLARTRDEVLDDIASWWVGDLNGEVSIDEVPEILHADHVPWSRRSGAGHAMALDL